MLSHQLAARVAGDVHGSAGTLTDRERRAWVDGRRRRQDGMQAFVKGPM
jgi:hypothetical protein